MPPGPAPGTGTGTVGEAEIWEKIIIMNHKHYLFGARCKPNVGTVSVTVNEV